MDFGGKRGNGMSFTEAIATCFRKYVEFRGRAARSEYWYWMLFAFIAGAALQTISDSLAAAFSLATFLPGIAVGARRLHDIDKSGWWLLIGFIPIIGWIVLIVWGIRRGDFGPNRFGPNPLMAPAR
jgi:uncharacterized membrane protein YhaH (DUF805 family)